MVRKITTSMSTIIKNVNEVSKCKKCKSIILKGKKFCLKHEKINKK